MTTIRNLLAKQNNYKKLSKLYPITIPASEARAISHAIEPSQLDEIMKEILSAACAKRTEIYYVSSTGGGLAPEIVGILTELGYHIESNSAFGARINWRL